MHRLASLAAGLARGTSDIQAVKDDLTTRTVNEVEDGFAEGSLATTGLPHQGQGLAFRQAEGNPIHCTDMIDHALEQTFLDRVVNLEVVHFQ